MSSASEQHVFCIPGQRINSDTLEKIEIALNAFRLIKDDAPGFIIERSPRVIYGYETPFGVIKLHTTSGLYCPREELWKRRVEKISYEPKDGPPNIHFAPAHLFEAVSHNLPTALREFALRHHFPSPGACNLINEDDPYGPLELPYKTKEITRAFYNLIDSHIDTMNLDPKRVDDKTLLIFEHGILSRTEPLLTIYDMTKGIMVKRTSIPLVEDKPRLIAFSHLRTGAHIDIQIHENGRTNHRPEKIEDPIITMKSISFINDILEQACAQRDKALSLVQSKDLPS